MSFAQAMFETNPSRADGSDALVACIRACFDCEQVCITCADACLGEQDA